MCAATRKKLVKRHTMRQNDVFIFFELLFSVVAPSSVMHFSGSQSNSVGLTQDPRKPLNLKIGPLVFYNIKEKIQALRWQDIRIFDTVLRNSLKCALMASILYPVVGWLLGKNVTSTLTSKTTK